MKNILITGVAGFIGSALAEFYLKQNVVVYGLDNFCSGTKNNINNLVSRYPKLFHFTEFDVISEWNEIKQSTSKIDLVYHLASPASVPVYQKLNLETMWVNSIGLKNALEFSDEQSARLIFSSTSEVYGSALQSPQSETHWGSVNSYGERSCYDESKRFGEALIYSSNKRNQTRHGLVRIFNTYGSNMKPDDGRVITQFIHQALQNKDITIYGDGQQTRSFCYIDDLIQGLSSYAATDLTGPINLGNDEEITIFDLAKNIIELTASKSKIIKMPLPSDDPPQRRPDLTHAKELLGFENKVSLQQGLKQMILLQLRL